MKASLAEVLLTTRVSRDKSRFPRIPVEEFEVLRVADSSDALGDCSRSKPLRAITMSVLRKH